MTSPSANHEPFIARKENDFLVGFVDDLDNSYETNTDVRFKPRKDISENMSRTEKNYDPPEVVDLSEYPNIDPNIDLDPGPIDLFQDKLVQNTSTMRTATAHPTSDLLTDGLVHDPDNLDKIILLCLLVPSLTISLQTI